MKSLQIQVNNQICDVDDDTAVGITFNGFNFSELNKLHLAFTNTFSLPITAKNRKIFGFPDNYFINSNAANSEFYDKYKMKMFIDGQFIFDGKLYVSNVTKDRIELYVVNGKDFADTLANVTLYDATEYLVEDLNADLDEAFPTGAQFDDVINYLSDGSNLAWLPYTIGTLLKTFPYAKSNDGVVGLANRYEENTSYNAEDERHICTEFITNSSVVGDFKTGHIYVKVKSVLEKVFSEVGYSLVFSANVDAAISQDWVRMIDLVLYENLIDHTFTFRADDLYKGSYQDKQGAAFSKKVKFLDFLKTVCAEYALLFDVKGDTIYFNTLNDIKSATVSNVKVANLNNRKFSIENINQKNVIGYSQINGSSTDPTTVGGLYVQCHNTNISEGSSEEVNFRIQRVLCGYFQYEYSSGGVVSETKALDTSKQNLNENIVIVRKDQEGVPYSVRVSRYYNYSESSYAVANLYPVKESTVSDNGFYNIFARAVAFPEEIELEAFIPNHFLANWSSFNYVKFNTLPGAWHITKINQWNARLSDQLVSLTAIRIR